MRLIVDDADWSRHHDISFVSRWLAANRSFVAAQAPSATLIITPAGTLEVDLPAANEEMPSLDALGNLAEVINDRLKSATVGRGPDLLLGVDGKLPNTTAPMQTLVHVNGDQIEIAFERTAVLKCYPAKNEEPHLWGMATPDRNDRRRAAPTRAAIIQVWALFHCSAPRVSRGGCVFRAIQVGTRGFEGPCGQPTRERNGVAYVR